MDIDKEIRLLRTIADLRIEKAALLEVLERIVTLSNDGYVIRCVDLDTARAAIAQARGAK